MACPPECVWREEPWLASLEQVMVRRPDADREVVGTLLDALAAALPYLRDLGDGDAMEQALVVLNTPLMKLDPVRLFSFVDPSMLVVAIFEPVRFRATLAALGLLADWPGPGRDVPAFWRGLWS